MYAAAPAAYGETCDSTALRRPTATAPNLANVTFAADVHRHQQRDEHGPVAAIPSPQPGVTDWAPSAVTPLGPWVDGEDLYSG